MSADETQMLTTMNMDLDVSLMDAGEHGSKGLQRWIIFRTEALPTTPRLRWPRRHGENPEWLT